MKVEIERKFLVTSNRFKDNYTKKIDIVQGYLNVTGAAITRIGIENDDISKVNIKEFTRSISRKEFEFNISINDGRELIKLCGDKIVKKTRWHCHSNGFLWEVAEFYGHNKGLILAEIELDSEDQKFIKPDWVGKDVSQLKKYYNTSLAQVRYV